MQPCARSLLKEYHTMRVLLYHRANVNEEAKKHHSALHGAAESGVVEAADLLLEYGGGISKWKVCLWSTVHVFTRDYKMISSPQTWDHAIEVFRLLCNNGATVNVQDFRKRAPLFSAVKYNQTELCKWLICRGGAIMLQFDSS
ncbi:hypothetical protein FI667_g5493, partial [Globisporangium splendens]